MSADSQHDRTALLPEPLLAPEVDEEIIADETPEKDRQAERERLRTLRALYVAIAAGSVTGSLSRWIVGLLFQGWFGGDFPWGTLFINVTGSFVIGFYAELTSPDGRLLVGPRMRQFVMTGVCGGYTTFSMFSLETLRLVQADRFGAAALYVGLSIATWLVAVWAGEVLAGRINRLRRG